VGAMHRLLCLGGPDLQVAQIAPILLMPSDTGVDRLMGTWSKGD